MEGHALISVLLHYNSYNKGADLGLSQLDSLAQPTKLLERGNVIRNLAASHEIQQRQMQNPASGR